MRSRQKNVRHTAFFVYVNVRIGADAALYVHAHIHKLAETREGVDEICLDPVEHLLGLGHIPPAPDVKAGEAGVSVDDVVFDRLMDHVVVRVASPYDRADAASRGADAYVYRFIRAPVKEGAQGRLKRPVVDVTGHLEKIKDRIR